ncbi:MAG TPA: ROK family glucokinase [Streptosporangiaceae bacterium]|nr:ROK family glucokinase [Streptosporangiaceae bacterium]
MSLAIGVDVGGTKIAAGVVDERGKVLEMVRRPTPAANAAGTIEVISDAVLELLAKYDVDAVGVGAAGFVEESRSAVLFAPNLAWRHEPVARNVRARTGRRVIVENDANAAAWAEAKFGAGRGHDHVVLITVGTGIGGGVVLNGELYRGRWGMAGEPGHYRVVPDGRLCGCGNRGCWEQYASGSALVAEAREFARRSPGAAVRLLQLAGGTPEGITGPAVTAAAREGDAAALRCFEIIGRWLGDGLADLAAILDPGCFVLGGGVSDAGDLLLGETRAAFENGLTGRQYRPHAAIVLAELGPDAGLIGAADLARQRLSRLVPLGIRRGLVSLLR